MIRRPSRIAALAGVTLSALAGWLVGCDEVYADPVTAPFTSSFGGPDASLTSTRVPPVQCPRTVRENGPCPQVGGVCEVGTSPDARCNTLFVCAADRTYGAYWTEQGAGSCKDVCPDPSQIVDGAPCTLAEESGPEGELHCTTPAGSCICTTGRDGAHAHERRWVCTRPAEGCPTKRPLLGQPCIGSLACDYGSCLSKRGSRMFCEDEVWQTEVGTCAD